jgi:acyl carrier protein
MTGPTRSDIFERLTAIFRNVFDDDSIALTEQTTARDIPQWDSLNHINLVIAVEQKFKVRFNTAQVAKMSNVGEFVNAILIKIPKLADQ